MSEYEELHCSFEFRGGPLDGKKMKFPFSCDDTRPVSIDFHFDDGSRAVYQLIKQPHPVIMSTKDHFQLVYVETQP